MTFNPRTFKTHAPNELQLVPLEFVHPSPDNVRLFVERESLPDLRMLYRRHNNGEAVMLPDAPIVRFKGWEYPAAAKGSFSRKKQPKLEILAGERRLTSATLEEIWGLPMRVVTMTDEEAFRFILAHNDVAALSTAELAYRAAEMDRLAFTTEEISAALKGASPGRYIAVGQLINPDWFTDHAKLCNPSIVEWFEASEFGPAHFETCFKMWNNGVWDDKQCAREFRKRGKALPLDNAERGFRITFDGNRLVLRGQLDLDYVDQDTAEAMMENVRKLLKEAEDRVILYSDFGDRRVIKVNPITVGAAQVLDDEDDDLSDLLDDELFESEDELDLS